MTEKEMVSLKEFLVELMNERDRRYQQRFQDQEKALDLALTNVKSGGESRIHLWTVLIAVVSLIITILGHFKVL